MKYATLNRYGCIAALAFLSFAVHAKPNSSTNAFTKSLSFIENKGQITDQYGKHRSDIDYKLDGSNVTMFVGDAQIHYQWYRANKKGKSKNEKNGLQGDSKSPSGDLGVGVYRMDVVLLGANKNAEVIKEGLQQDYENYYLPQCPDGVTAHRYSKITYKNIYPNIDWEIETAPLPSPKGEASSHGCKYSFIVHPGGDYRNIKIQYNGATSITLKNGALVASTPMGSITENVPYTYDAATRKEIRSNFILNNNILSYNIGLPSGSGEGNAPAFIIDPTLNWATYYGDSSTSVNRIFSDTLGNIYMVGDTKCLANIATTGSYQAAISGDLDGFIVKFSSGGTRAWATYYGGSLEDRLWDGATDGSSIYAGGYAYSAGLASTSSHQQFLGGGAYDALLVKFNAAGLRQWATYYGGTGIEIVAAIACDNKGNVFISGHTSSTSNIITSSAHQSLMGSSADGYIAKFSGVGVRQWGTYYGGTDNTEGVNSLCTDICGNLYIYGSTSSPNNIASTGAYQTIQTGGNVFFGKFSSNGVRQWATYYPISQSVPAIATDAAGSVYITGYTNVTTGISTPGSFQPVYGGGSADAVLAKFNAAGQRVWGTYFGGGGYEGGSGVFVNPGGYVYIAGLTTSTSGISTPGAPQTIYGGNGPNGMGDCYVATFDTNGQRVWASYYGSTDFDGAGNPVVSRDGKLYFAGGTASHTGIATTGAFKTSYTAISSNDYTSFLASFISNDTTIVLREPFADTVHCQGDSMFVYYRTSYTFNTGNTFTIQLSNASGSFASPTNIGMATATATGFVRCHIPLTTPAGQSYRIRLVSTSPARTMYMGGTECPVDIHIYTLPAKPNATSNAPICAGQTLNLNAGSSGSGFTYGWEGPNTFTSSLQNPSIPNAQTSATGDYYITVTEPVHGCKNKDTVSVTINTTPSKPNATSNSPICSGQTLNLFATTTTGGVSWNWVGPGGFNTSAQNPTIPNAQTANAGSYVVTATLGNCSSSDTEVVVINQGPAVNVYPSPNDTICQGGSVTLVALPVSAGTGPSFQWYKNSNPIGGATNTSYSTTPNNGDVYYCQMTPGTGTSCTGAINSNSITITVLPVTTPSVSISGPAGAQDPYNLLTFHATGTGAGSSPTYQWLRSGQLVQGAIADTWSTQGLYLSQHDTICVILTSSDICAIPKSDTACMVVNILTGVDDVNKNTTIQLYPNPNDGIFILHANSINDKDASIEISDVVGKVVYQETATAKKGIIDVRIDIHQLAAGVYILNLNDKTGRRPLRFVISR